jgi:glutamate synthase (ferredoxin)
MTRNASSELGFGEKDACGVGLLYRPTASHQVIVDALSALAAVEHRGACGADGISGDGAGILTSIPWQIIAADGFDIAAIRAVGAVFLPVEPGAYEECRKETERFLREEELHCVGWRVVPVKEEVLGEDARATMPNFEQVLVGCPENWDENEIERRLMVVRKRLLNFLWRKPQNADFYISSLSTTTIVYKAMTTGLSLRKFYTDLQSDLFTAKFAIFHRRFSTNTLPRWRLAQPFRILGHNGEINTLAGNRKGLLAKSQAVESAGFQSYDRNDWPLVHPGGSDSANLDNLLEFLLCAGLSPEEALMRLIPEACGEHGELCDPAVAAFYEYHAALQEPWDGPALLVYSDGRTAGALLDKNGLRPARYTIMTDGSVFLCSETGALPLPPHLVAKKGRLGAGEIISINLDSGQVRFNDEVRKTCASVHPYAQWLSEERIELERQSFEFARKIEQQELTQQLIAAGVGVEELDLIYATAETGKEPVFSMGDDAALAVLSSKPRSLYDYFKQRFAQVTNPPIDHLRERSVMSLATYLGPKSQSVIPSRSSAHLIKAHSPIFNDNELQELTRHAPDFSTKRVSLLAEKSKFNLAREIQRICEQAADAIRAGNNLIILSDREVTSDQIAVPAVAAVGAVHNYLIQQRLRTCASILIDTAQCWNPHQFACLLGYGAEAVSPYLVWQALALKSNDNDYFESYRHAIEDALLKILSKMGITMLSSYIGGQLFEIVGLSREVIDKCFEGTPAQLLGLSFNELARETLAFHNLAFASATQPLPDHGLLKNRKSGEFHGNNTDVVRTLHRALGLRDGKTPQEEKHAAFKEYSDLVKNRAPSAVRDLLTFTSDRKPIPLDQVESAEDIARRFCTGGMSLGALSQEAHETLAIAMNRLGGKSNSGEGGEDPRRYRTERASAIRQIASARFGVTAEYIATAKQLEIKMAQGAKPGEGGQLPAHKVSDYIGALRRAKSGITLISPPPHHDIYSIEDLAQLIFDLRQVNPRAAISVKLVSSTGIGTIAAGVAKANADIVQISGHDGGTGASPVSSIKHAGMPWEFGLAEVHQTLLASRLRDRVILRVDGGIRTGWDVITAALLGAEEFGFGSIALVAAGCIMARVCHTNNCPVGITSQKEELREKFTATPDQIVEFFLFVAEEIRMILAELGYRGLSEIVGRTDLLSVRADVKLPKVSRFDVTALLNPFVTGVPQRTELPHSNGDVLDDYILTDASIKNAIEAQTEIEKSIAIANTDRSVGSRIAGLLASQYGDEGFAGQLTLKFSGTAGQSFGAFAVRGLSLELTGEANDYVGKGMNGGQIVIRPEPEVAATAYGARHIATNVIIGNACLYGATGGTLYAAGIAGERFAVRNSGATAVIEGAGAHCCEYMTGGTVVVLGSVGQNFGAGMSAGRAFVLDMANDFPSKVNSDMGKVLNRISPQDEAELLDLIQTHHALTGSRVSDWILSDWAVASAHFIKVSFPTEVPAVENVANVLRVV